MEENNKSLLLDNETGLFNFLSAALTAHPKEHDIVLEFSKLYDEFINFANAENAMQEEAKQIHKMQGVRKKVSQAANFPAIYGKRIGAVGGAFGSGKSSFINSFITDKFIELPVGLEPLNAIPFYLTCQNAGGLDITCHTQNGGLFTIAFETFKSITNDSLKSLNFKLKEAAASIAINVPLAEKLFSDICLIDMPGRQDGDFAAALEADFIIWIVDINADILPPSEIEFLNKIANEKFFDLYIVANKADLLKDKNDCKSIINGIENKIKNLNLIKIKYCGVCAYSSIEKKEYLYEKQGIYDFIESNNFADSKRYREIAGAIDEVLNDYKQSLADQKREYEENLKLIKHVNLDIDIENQNAEIQIRQLRNFFNTKQIDEYLQNVGALQEKFRNCISPLKRDEDVKKMNAGQIINFLYSLKEDKPLRSQCNALALTAEMIKTCAYNVEAFRNLITILHILAKHYNQTYIAKGIIELFLNSLEMYLSAASGQREQADNSLKNLAKSFAEIAGKISQNGNKLSIFSWETIYNGFINQGFFNTDFAKFDQKKLQPFYEVCIMEMPIMEGYTGGIDMPSLVKANIKRADEQIKAEKQRLLEAEKERLRQIEAEKQRQIEAENKLQQEKKTEKRDTIIGCLIIIIIIAIIVSLVIYIV
jgi:GTPase SAR1 family protein